MYALIGRHASEVIQPGSVSFLRMCEYTVRTRYTEDGAAKHFLIFRNRPLTMLLKKKKKKKKRFNLRIHLMINTTFVTRTGYRYIFDIIDEIIALILL